MARAAIGPHVLLARLVHEREVVPKEELGPPGPALLRVYAAGRPRRRVRLLREGLKIPILTLEGDRPGPVDGAILTRIEAFLEMLN